MSIATALFSTAATGVGPAGQPELPAPELAAAMAQYLQELREYANAQQTYTAASQAYWASIAQKRKLRTSKRANSEELTIDDYILTQPPVYSGPPQPINPSVPKERVPPAPAFVPVVGDFLAAAAQEFHFSPRKPQNEIEFKRAYARAAAAAGLTKDQVVRIYGFEATGNGTYDVQAGLEYNKPGEHAVSTALGYNQLLATNSVELMAEQGSQFLETLNDRAAQLLGDQKESFQSKIAIVQEMINFSTSVPDDWSQHEILAGTVKGLGIHAMNLDLDVGPLLQTQKLLDSVLFARAKGLTATLSAAELEMMNLTGDGNGFDMVTMPSSWRGQVPTANFFQPHGYEDNPVAQRNNVVASLIAATDAQMDEEVQKQGAKDLAEAFSQALQR
jgi:hypothetical protein